MSSFFYLLNAQVCIYANIDLPGRHMHICAHEHITPSNFTFQNSYSKLRGPARSAESNFKCQLQAGIYEISQLSNFK